MIYIQHMWFVNYILEYLNLEHAMCVLLFLDTEENGTQQDSAAERKALKEEVQAIFNKAYGIFKHFYHPPTKC